MVFVTATGFGLLETLNAFVGTRIRGLSLGWWDLLVQNLPWWYTWALLTPAVLWMARRLPLLELGSATRRIPLHAVAALLLSSLHLWITGTIFYYTTARLPLSVPSLQALVWNWHANFLMPDVVTYAMILGAFHWVEFYGRYHDGLVEAARLSARAAELERGVALARLEALQKELNPHFLFNALNAVAGLIRRGEPHAAVTMLARLSDLLRLTLDAGLPVEIPLERELALLERYLAIEQTRFGDRLTIEVDVPQDLRSVLVPALLLQPVVENAIRHGVGRLPGPGRIRLVARADRDRLRLDVEDTGPGFPVDPPGEPTFGVGLSNTRARLTQLYDGPGEMVTGNGPAGGAVVSLWIPIRG